MAEGNSPGSCIVSLLFLGLGIAILVLTIKMYIYTKENPFKEDLPETYSEREQKYFITSQASLFQKQCVCENEVLNDFCTEEQIQSGCKDLTLNQQQNPKLFLRYLQEFDCKIYRDKILNISNKNLRDVFNLNFDMINKMALGLIILAIIGFAVVGSIFFSFCAVLCCGEAGIAFFVLFLPCILLFGLGSTITEFVLFIILCVNYSNSNISDYVQFLDCRDVNKSAFSDYSVIEDVKSIYIPFMVLYIIFFVINFLQKYCSYDPKKKE